jgi:hypothetical protein
MFKRDRVQASALIDRKEILHKYKDAGKKGFLLDARRASCA